MKTFRLSWFIVGLVGLLLISGLGWDMWRTYAVKKNFERHAVLAAQAAAKNLPWEPKLAIAAGNRYFEEAALKTDVGAVVVPLDGMSVDVTIHSEVRAYVAWMLGSPSLHFGATAHGDIQVLGGGPPASMAPTAVAFGMRQVPDVRVGQELLVWTSEPAPPDYAFEAYEISTAETLQVGGKVPIKRITDLSKYSSNALRYVVILDELGKEEGYANVKGFAALRTMRLDLDGRLMAKFEKAHLDGTPDRQLGEEHHFGLWQGGEVRADVRLVRGS